MTFSLAEAYQSGKPDSGRISDKWIQTQTKEKPMDQTNIEMGVFVKSIENKVLHQSVHFKFRFLSLWSE